MTSEQRETLVQLTIILTAYQDIADELERPEFPPYRLRHLNERIGRAVRKLLKGN